MINRGINALIEFCANNRFLVFVFVAAAVLGGVWGIRHVPLDALRIFPTLR